MAYCWPLHHHISYTQVSARFLQLDPAPFVPRDDSAMEDRAARAEYVRKSILLPSDRPHLDETL
jgi:hypothetical protein